MVWWCKHLIYNYMRVLLSAEFVIRDLVTGGVLESAIKAQKGETVKSESMMSANLTDLLVEGDRFPGGYSIVSGLFKARYVYGMWWEKGWPGLCY